MNTQKIDPYRYASIKSMLYEIYVSARSGHAPDHVVEHIEDEIVTRFHKVIEALARDQITEEDAIRLIHFN